MSKSSLCKTCGSLTHYATFCFQTKRKAIKKQGKVAAAWEGTKSHWKILNPATEVLYGFKIWRCHYCGCALVENRKHHLFVEGVAMFLTLDHIKPRSSKPQLRSELNNIVPACYPDNVLKGSMDYIRFLERYYPKHPALTAQTNGMVK